MQQKWFDELARQLAMRWGDNLK